MIDFGAGALIAVPKRLADGTAILNPTPVKLAILQDVTLDLSVDLKTLHGAHKFPVAVAQGKGEIGLKVKSGNFSGAVLGDMYFGVTPTSGVRGVVIDQLATAVASDVDAVMPVGATFVEDLGVQYAESGLTLTRVAAAPAAGQYIVDVAGQYTLSAADATAQVVLSFEYLHAAGAGKIHTMTNQLMGYTPSFSLVLQKKFMGKTLTMKLYQGVCGKLSLPYKNDDFTINDFEIQAFANAANQIGWMCIEGE